MAQADARDSIISPKHDNSPVYRSTPACERGCARCEVACAVSRAVVEQFRRDLRAAEEAWLSFMPGPSRAH